MKKILSILTICHLMGCSSTTIVKTNDPEVNIYVNGKYKGKGSAVHTDMKMSWLSSTVRLEKDNCQDAYESFSKDEQIDLLPLISGFLFIIPFAWTMKYNAVHEFNYVCKPN